MAGAAAKRIPKELAALNADPIPGVKVNLVNDDIHIWDITIAGPSGTPFADGTYHMKMTLPNDYPFKPPVVAFTTKIYHPNVSNDGKGTMCLGLLRPDQWKPNSKLADVIRFAQHILREPDPDDAVEQSIAAEYKDERKKWEQQAREWNKQYAKGK